MFAHSYGRRPNPNDQAGNNASSPDLLNPLDQFGTDTLSWNLPVFGVNIGTPAFSGLRASVAPIPAATCASPQSTGAPAEAASIGASGPSGAPVTVTLAGGSTAVVSTPGSGLVFNNTYSANCTAQFEACIVAAEDELESLFTNSDTINVSFDAQNSGNNGVALGNSSSGYLYGYGTVKNALHAAAPGDVLPSADPSGGSTQWYVPEAYGRMLGLTSATGSPDLSVSLNTYYGWSFGQDVIDGLIHELSEGGLGRIGGLGGAGNGYWGTMDLFRYNAAGQADYSNGRDGATTYFSSHGGAGLSDQNLPSKGAPTLSYNNQYNSDGSKNNGGDTADWVQNQVFGSTGGGETLTLTQTELDLLQALGWKLSLKQDVDATSGTWETPADWSTGSMPIEPQDAYINNAIVSLDSNVIVNSIATSAGGILTIGSSAPTTLVAVHGTNLNAEDTSSVASGNLGDIGVYTGSALQIGYVNDTFDNAGTLILGKGAGGSGAGYLDIAATITLNGGGTVQLGENGTAGDILNGSNGAGGVVNGNLVNVDNTIKTVSGGTGLISLGSGFDNQSSGKVDSAGILRITTPSLTNEGTMTAEAGATLALSSGSTFTNSGTITGNSGGTLDLGADGATEKLTNSGAIHVGVVGASASGSADLAISGNLTVAGSGLIGFKGAGANITSDGKAPATLTNASAIDAFASGQIGDQGILASNDLTLVNTGSVLADGSGVTLTLNTGSNTIVDGGGTLEAEYSATLVIDSKVNTGQSGLASPGGTIEAGSGGTVILGAAVQNGVVGPSAAGQVVIAGGTVELLAGSSVNVPIEFTAGGTLEILGIAAVNVSGSNGTITAVAGDTIALTSGTGDTVSGNGVTIANGAGRGITIKGTADVVYAGLNDSLTDDGTSTVFKIASNVGGLTILNFASDPSGIIDLLGGAGGYNSAASAYAALTSDGSGGSLLSLGADGSIDLQGVAKSSLHASNFKIN